MHSPFALDSLLFKQGQVPPSHCQLNWVHLCWDGATGCKGMAHHRWSLLLSDLMRLPWPQPSPSHAVQDEAHQAEVSVPCALELPPRRMVLC